ncbi:MAG: hypothetical protein WCJ48_06460 [Actinomycetes bacterium]
MSPDFDLRTRVMMAALEDVIIPAIDPGNALAIEQSKLLLGGLAMMRDQVDYYHAYETVELTTLTKLLGSLLLPDDPAAEEVTALIAAGYAATGPVIATSSLKEISRNMRSAARTLIDAAAAKGDQAERDSQQAVLAYSDEALTRERAWSAGYGFDVFPETMLSIPESLTLAK